jgi:hypothetical protein
MRTPEAVPEPPVASPGTRTVLGKVVAVLFAFSAEDYGLTLAELGRRTGLAKGTFTASSTTWSRPDCWNGPTTATG